MTLSLIKNNVILVIQLAAAGLVPLVLLPHVVAIVGLAEYGRIAVAMSVAGYAVILVQYAFQLTGPPRILQTASPAHDAGTFLSIARAKAVLLAVALVVLVVAAAASDWIGSVALVVGVCLPLAAALNAAWYLQARGHFSDVLLCALAGAGTALAIGFGLVRPGVPFGPTLAALALCASPFVQGAFSLVAAIRRLPARPVVDAPLQSVGTQLRQGAMLFLSQFTSTGYMLAGPILIARLDGPAAAGMYSVMERIINTAVAVCLLTHTAAYPQLARLFTESRTQYWRLLRVVLIAYFMLSGTLAAGLLVLREPVLHHFFAGEIAAEAGTLLAWALLFLVTSIFGPLLTGSLVVSGRNREVLPVTAGLLVLTLGIGVPLLISYGASGWMAALAIAQCALGAYALLRWYWLRASAVADGNGRDSDQPGPPIDQH